MLAETWPASDLAIIGLGIFSLSNSNPTLISPILMRSRWLAVFLRYLLIGADLGLDLLKRLLLLP